MRFSGVRREFPVLEPMNKFVLVARPLTNYFTILVCQIFSPRFKNLVSLFKQEPSCKQRITYDEGGV